MKERKKEGKEAGKLTPQYFQVLRDKRKLIADTATQYGTDSEQYRERQRQAYATWRHCMAMLPKHWLEICGSYSIILHSLLETYCQLDRSSLPLSARLRLRLIPGFAAQTFVAWLCHAPHRIWELAMIRFMPQDRWWDVWHRRTERHILEAVGATYIAAPDSNAGREVVAMLGDASYSGGLVDRLRGAVSVYIACQATGREFRIHFAQPFALEDYLAPADYDWRIAPTAISRSKKSTARLAIVSFTGSSSVHRRQQHEMETFLDKNRSRQTHVYSSAGFCFEHDFGVLFRQLFRPVPRLEHDIESVTAGLGSDYVSVSARFLNLLGDFNEAIYSVPLSPERQRALLDTCLAALSDIHTRHPESRLVVCSDSRRFTDEAAERDYVAVVPGVITHIDNDSQNTWEYYEKTFLDFFCIARAAKSYLLIAPGMWRSSFPYAAAWAGGHHLQSVEIGTGDGTTE